MTVQGGGFFWQSRSVANALADEFDLHFLSPDDERAFPGSGLPSAPWHKISPLTNLADPTRWRKVCNLVRALQETYAVIVEVDPDAVVCVATSLAVPLCFWGKLRGKKTVFVESITRVSTPSTTGLLLSRLGLCDRLYVQWPEAESLYRGAVCKGTVL